MQDPFGKLNRPTELDRFGDVQNGGIGKLLNLFIYVLIIGGGIYALFNFILAGYGFLGSGGDPKRLEAAWSKITQSIIGLLFMASALVLAAIIGKLIFGEWSFIISPVIPTP